MVEVLLASRNRKKLAEMHRILEPLVPGVRVLGLDDVAVYDEPVEDRDTFEGNAVLKALAGVRATGLPTVADDSGLCVDALNGMPGVLSARWSGRGKDDDRNNALLLDQLADVPEGDEKTLSIEHPTGEMTVIATLKGGEVTRTAILRTARKLMDGSVFV